MFAIVLYGEEQMFPEWRRGSVYDIAAVARLRVAPHAKRTTRDAAQQLKLGHSTKHASAVAPNGPLEAMPPTTCATNTKDSMPMFAQVLN